MVRDIRSSVLGQRVANIYDLSDKIYLFKFAVPGVAKKTFLLVESGMRFHTTKFTRDKNDMPSPFSMKLRKHIRLKRLEDIRQLGSDRVVDIKFGSGDAICHIILELYSSGNIVLTNGNYEIIALLRSHKFEEDISVQVGEIYPIAFTSTVALAEPSSNNAVVSSMNSIEFMQWSRDRYNDMIQQNIEIQNMKSEVVVEKTASVKSKKGGSNSSASVKKVRLKKMNLRQLLLCKESGVALFGPEILDHCLLVAGLNPVTKVEDFLKMYGDVNSENNMREDISHLLRELRETAPGLLALLDTPGQAGYILIKKESSDKTSSSPDCSKSTGDYFDFVPRLYRQHQENEFVEFDSFDAAVDEYFCKVEEQRLQHIASTAEEAAKKKVKKVEDEMRNQLQGLVDTQLKMEKAACLTEAFAEEVDKACLVVNSALGAGISWDDITTMVATETAAGNPIASMISKLKLDKNRIVIRLPDILAESDGDSDVDSDSESQHSYRENKKEFIDVDLDLALSAYANASKLYSQRKVAVAKEQKTAIAAERAVKAVELSSSKQLVKQQVKRNLQAQRKVHWFEKFNWFVSSEGYLVLSGRDAQQNEQLVKKYLRVGDAYVHADMHGASSCIVRCKMKKDPVTGSEKPLPISPFALTEAGTMTICRSGAWSAKIVMSAWWVNSSQVSKSAPTGEYLSTGSFMIYGKKNYLPPTSLEMGFGILFRLDDGSVSRHISDREDKNIVVNDDDDGVPEVIKHDIKSGNNISAEEKDENGKSGKQKKIRDIKKGGENNTAEEKNDKVDVAESALPINKSEVPTGVVEETQDNNVISETVEDNIQENVQTGVNVESLPVKEREKGSGKVRLTPYQRKLLKKGKTLEEIEEIQAAKRLEKDILVEDASVEQRNDDEDTHPPHQSVAKENSSKKKKLSKKKARRYANQDEEDVRLAMHALGHHDKAASVNIQKEDGISSIKNTEEKSIKENKAGIHLLKADSATALSQLSIEVKSQLENLFAKSVVKESELDSYELTNLASFSPEEGLEILALFDCDNISGIGNKSGFLAGIMRRYSREKEKKIIKQRQKTALEFENIDEVVDETADLNFDSNIDLSENVSGGISRRERKKAEANEIQLILQEEGVLDEQEGKLAADLEKLTGNPLPEDILLYAVPICGPYSALKTLKYKVKLTPGTIKKGKACKNAVDVFINSKVYASSGGSNANSVDSSADVAMQVASANKERTLIKGLTDPEMVSIMIGDVKLSMPGLYNTLKKKKEAAKKGKKK